MENENCMVLSDTSDTPTVFDRTLMEPIGPWQIVKELDPELVKRMPNNRATDRALKPFTEFDFMRETDDDLGWLVAGQAQVCCVGLALVIHQQSPSDPEAFSF